MSEQEENGNTGIPIFVFGCARSGTSLLSRILNSHPKITVPYESHLYNTFIPWLDHYGDLSVEKNRWRLICDMDDTLHDWTPRIDRKMALKAVEHYDFGGVVDGVMSSYAAMQGKTRWGEKSPWHVFYWKKILCDFPNAKFIHIVRDGRDSSASWKQARFGPKHYYVLARRWTEYLETVAEFKRAVGDENIFEFKYEDLLDSPEKISQGICEFIGEEYSPEMLAFHENKTPYPTDSRNNENLTQPLMTGNVEKWRKNLSEKELYVFEAVAGQQLHTYGYEVINNEAALSKATIFYIRLVLHPFLRMCSMVKNTKGQVDGLKKLYVYGRLRLRLKK